MDPLSLLLNAIVAGAAAALKPTAQQAVKDAYEAFKSLVKRKFSRIEIESLERDPTSKKRQDLVREDLEKSGDLSDREVLALAQRVLATVATHEPSAATDAGITIEDLRAGASVNLEDLVAEGSVAVHRISAEKDITIKGVRAGNPTRR